MRTRLQIASLALPIVAVALVACGGGNVIGTSAQSNTPPATTTPAPNPNPDTSTPVAPISGTGANLIAVTPENKTMPGLEFNTIPWAIDSQGSLPGMVFFAQSQVFPATSRISDDYQPHATALRDTLVLFKAKPGDLIEGKAVLLNAYSANGVKLNRDAIIMAHPNDIPKTPKFLSNVDLSTVSFDTNPTNPTVIATQAALTKLNDLQATYLKTILATTNSVNISLADGAWTSSIYLPNGNFSGKNILVSSRAGYSSTVKYASANGLPNFEVITNNSITPFTYIANVGWVAQSDTQHSRYVYGKDFWSAKLPKEWIQPGLRLEFVQGGKSSTLNFAANGVPGLAIGAPSELLMHVIDIGMLTTAQNMFDFAKEDAAHAEYFQTIPASRFIVNRYESLQLDKVYMPDGRVFSPGSPDPSVGGWQSGDMRELIAKLLISHGIDNANYGISSSSAISESGHPFWAAQLTAHTSRGLYANGTYTHGGSGGAGMVTLESSIGNEFSHEVGHNYGLSHGSGSRGVLGAIHRPSVEVNSTWAWDSRLNLFIPNFVSKPTFQNINSSQAFEKTCNNIFSVAELGKVSPTECVAPFQVSTANGITTAFSFGRDAMSDGAPNAAPYWSQINRFTIYTPYSASQIQTFLESKVVFDKTSSTGFRKWNPGTYTMVEVAMRTPYWTVATADTDNQLVGATYNVSRFTAYLQGLFDAGADVVSVQMGDGQWAANAAAPAASANDGKYLNIIHTATSPTNWTIDGNANPVKFVTSNQQSYRSIGGKWIAQPTFVDGMIDRKPEAFGVPVTTLVGYYDPQISAPTPARPGWPGYIYPALHAAYGYVYPSESISTNKKGCWIEVTLRNTTRRYKLLSTRVDAGYMNKFQINVPESEGASSATVICNGITVAVNNALFAAKSTLAYTVNGMPLN